MDENNHKITHWIGIVSNVHCLDIFSSFWCRILIFIICRGRIKRRWWNFAISSKTIEGNTGSEFIFADICPRWSMLWFINKIQIFWQNEVRSKLHFMQKIGSGWKIIYTFWYWTRKYFQRLSNLDRI